MKQNPSIIVKKFGGTSVGTAERILNVAQRLKKDVDRGEKPVVVVSAMSGETNRLVALAQSIDQYSRGPAYDLLLASGEQVTVGLLAIALEKLGVKAQPLLAFQLGIETDSVYSKARIKNIRTEALNKCIQENKIPVVAGFQGIDEFHNITTLGRGGSDTTAVALAAALGCKECEIYTDVPAVFSADPRLVPRAKELKKISFDEMMEMASLGSKVLHIRSVEIGAKYQVRIHLRSTFEDRPGTWIVPEGEIMEEAVVSSVTHDPNTIVFKMYPVPPETSFLSNLFTKLAEKAVVVDIITQSQGEKGQRLAFSVTQEDLPLAEKSLQELLAVKQDGNNIEVEIMKKMAKISVVGVGMRNHPGVAARFFKILSSLNIPIHLVTTSEIKISAVIDETHLKAAAENLHHEFELDGVINS
jgi:aspartate kinase